MQFPLQDIKWHCVKKMVGFVCSKETNLDFYVKLILTLVLGN